MSDSGIGEAFFWKGVSSQFDLFTPLAPSRVVDVTTASEKPGNAKGVVVINKIEYADGTTWVRPGWNAATFSAEATQKVEAADASASDQSIPPTST